MVEQRRASLGQLVQHQRAAGDLGENGEQPDASGRLQHAVGRRNACGRAGRNAKRDRGRELLERLALHGAARMGGEEVRDLRQHRQQGGRRTGSTEKRLAVFADEEDRHRLAGVVGGFPIPRAGRIRGAEGRLHGGPQNARVDAPAAFEIGEEELSGLRDGGRCRRK